MTNILRILLGTGLILSIPLIAMQFTDEVQWGLFDFIAIGGLLIGAGLVYEFITPKLKTKQQRVILAIFVALAVLLVWADLAVGIFNIPGFSGS